MTDLQNWSKMLKSYSAVYFCFISAAVYYKWSCYYVLQRKSLKLFRKCNSFSDMGEPENKEADAGRKIIFSYGFVRDSDMDTKEMFLMARSWKLICLI